jgi:hypothetical protein
MSEGVTGSGVEPNPPDVEMSVEPYRADVLMAVMSENLRSRFRARAPQSWRGSLTC